MSQIEEIRQNLARLSRICDTGFALALHIRFTRPTILYQTYPPEWIRFYRENGFMLSDPVIRWGLRETGFIRWSDIQDEDHAGVMDHAASYGLKYGVAFTLGQPSSRSITGLTKSVDDFSGAEVDEMIATVTRIHELTETVADLPPEELEAIRALAAPRLG